MKHIKEELDVQNDMTLSDGQPSHLALPKEKVMIYTPTWIVSGTVISAGPLVIELSDPHIVYDTGQHGRRPPNADEWESLDRSPWPGCIMRVPAIGVIVVVLDYDK